MSSLCTWVIGPDGITVTDCMRAIDPGHGDLTEADDWHEAFEFCPWCARRIDATTVALSHEAEHGGAA